MQFSFSFLKWDFVMAEIIFILHSKVKTDSENVYRKKIYFPDLHKKKINALRKEIK